MVILDSDHFSPLIRGSSAGRLLAERLAAVSKPIVTTIVTIEEMLRGRLAKVAASKSAVELIAAYGRLHDAFTSGAQWRILSFDAASSVINDRLRADRVRVGTMDLRIASIVLANDATLLSRNLRDFQRVPELKVEDWLS